MPYLPNVKNDLFETVLLFCFNFYKFLILCSLRTAKMRKIFQHKYIFRVLTFLALALPLLDLINWKMREYRLKNLPFEISSPPTPSYLFIFVSLTLFLSLILTKRIVLSLLFVFLFLIQSLLLGFILSKIETTEIGTAYYYFSYFETEYFKFVLVAFLIPLSFWLSFSICRFCNQRFQTKTFLR
jgi:hypothetical protein